jgi:hypothetical protein
MAAQRSAGSLGQTENTEETRTQHAVRSHAPRTPRHCFVTNGRWSPCPPTNEFEKNLRVGLDIFAVECLILAMNALHACIPVGDDWPAM